VSGALEPAPAQRDGGARERLLGHAAAVLGTTADRVDPRRSLRELGLDSLMAVQLRRILQQDTGVEIPTGRLLGDERVAALLADLEAAAGRPGAGAAA
jgi:acyl carrier protein